MIDYKAYHKLDIEKGEDLPFFVEDVDDELYFVMQKDEDIRYPISVVFGDDDWIICQYTGVLDKKGKKLYDKDNVSYMGYNCKIKWSTEFCGWAIENLEIEGLGDIPLGIYGAKPYELEWLNL